jgi:hypothetical protein
LDDGRPGGVELGDGSRRAAARDAVRLGHPGDGDAYRERSVTDCNEIKRVDIATCPVAEHEQC